MPSCCQCSLQAERSACPGKALPQTSAQGQAPETQARISLCCPHLELRGCFACTMDALV